MSWLASACIILSLATVQAAPPNVQHGAGSGPQPQRPEPQPPATRVTIRPEPPAAKSASNPSEPKQEAAHHGSNTADKQWATWEDVKGWLGWKPGMGWSEVAAFVSLLAALVGLIVSALTLIVTGLFFCYTYLMWKEMVRQNAHAETAREESAKEAEKSQELIRKQLEAYERPWLTVSIVPASSGKPSPEQFKFCDDGSAFVWFNLAIENIGKSLATKVFVRTRLVPMSDTFLPYWRTLLSDLQITAGHTGEFTLFPGEINNHLDIVRQTSGEKIKAALFRLTPDGADLVLMVVIGRVTYRFSNSENPHHTDFAYLIAESGVTHYMRPGILLVDTIFGNPKPLAPDKIEWIKLPGDDAD